MVYPSLIWEIPTEKKEIFLTFDDGPTPGITEQVLEMLDVYQAKATFFLIGDKVGQQKKIINDIKLQGHAIGNHTFNHLKGWGTDDITYLENIEKTNQLLPSKLFRPPFGRIKRSQLIHLRQHYHIIMWSVLSADFDHNITPERCYLNVMEKTREGSIIVFHDSEKASKNMLYTLPRILEAFSKKGYQFKNLEFLNHITPGKKIR
jgi:peptidoglycan/xylan/chitin deacetylase (PgdA/CDA1 family)